MRNTLLALAAMLFFTASARAVNSVQPTVEIGALQVKASVTPVNANPLAITAYQDWGSATGDQPAGVGVLQGVVTTGLNSLSGDDATLVPLAVGQRLTSMGFSIGNNNAGTGDGFGVITGN